MSFHEFLEDYGLYQKFDFTPPVIRNFPRESINMECQTCKDVRTFVSKYSLYREEDQLIETSEYPIVNVSPKPNSIFLLIYQCASCKKFERFFLLQLGDKLKTIKKIGQEPPWDISIPKELKEIYNKYSDYYKKGLICEFHNFGIGANIYYRRITEEVINVLLNDISEFIDEKNIEKYNDALEKMKSEKIITKKIELVKDLLPPTLKSPEANPLKVIYDVLSEGIHSKSDEDCLRDAILIRTSLSFLVNNVIKRKREKQDYTQAIKQITKIKGKDAFTNRK